MQRFIDYVYFIKFIGITHFVYSGILLLYLIKQHIHQPFIRQWGLDAPNKFVYFPITFSSKTLVCLAIEGPGASGTTQTSIGEVYMNKMYLRNNGGSNITCTYFVLGK